MPKRSRPEILHQQSTRKIRITPVYNHNISSNNDPNIAIINNSTTSSAIMSLPVVLGRKNLCLQWWQSCPNQCPIAAAMKQQSPPNSTTRSNRRSSCPSCRVIRQPQHLQQVSKRVLLIHANGNVSVVAKNVNLVHCCCWPKEGLAGNLWDGDICELKIGPPQQPWMVFRIQLIRAVTPQQGVARQNGTLSSSSSSSLAVAPKHMGDKQAYDASRRSSSMPKRRRLFGSGVTTRNTTNGSDDESMNDDSSLLIDDDNKYAMKPRIFPSSSSSQGSTDDDDDDDRKQKPTALDNNNNKTKILRVEQESPITGSTGIMIHGPVVEPFVTNSTDDDTDEPVVDQTCFETQTGKTITVVNTTTIRGKGNDDDNETMVLSGLTFVESHQNHPMSEAPPSVSTSAPNDIATSSEPPHNAPPVAVQQQLPIQLAQQSLPSQSSSSSSLSPPETSTTHGSSADTSTRKSSADSSSSFHQSASSLLKTEGTATRRTGTPSSCGSSSEASLLCSTEEIPSTPCTRTQVDVVKFPDTRKEASSLIDDAPVVVVDYTYSSNNDNRYYPNSVTSSFVLSMPMPPESSGSSSAVSPSVAAHDNFLFQQDPWHNNNNNALVVKKCRDLCRNEWNQIRLQQQGTFAGEMASIVIQQNKQSESPLLWLPSLLDPDCTITFRR